MNARLPGAGALALLLLASPAGADVDAATPIDEAAVQESGAAVRAGMPYRVVPHGYIAARPQYTQSRHEQPRRDYYFRAHSFGHRPYRYYPYRND